MCFYFIDGWKPLASWFSSRFFILEMSRMYFWHPRGFKFSRSRIGKSPAVICVFCETFVKEENFELNERYSDDYKDPLITNGKAQDQSDITSSENLLLLPIVPKLSNINENLIDIEIDNREAVIEEASSNDLAKKYKHIEEFFIWIIEHKRKWHCWYRIFLRTLFS